MESMATSSTFLSYLVCISKQATPDMNLVKDYGRPLLHEYCILGDGCQMEGITNEACLLAGHWGLGKLIALYDDNHISIGGDTEKWKKFSTVIGYLHTRFLKKGKQQKHTI
ncbi:hypothetical protein L1987_59456 [Smallanthus sonchifolius]|uniref:Uncharacterized protein n=1 Tax=Smallanthus sonchifolius TaxID=185202 RepID=A0ACB9D5B7_9ASTR|nr:hypothetical protein L1987_59456 [Smallanthus sonchifolius]